MTIKFDTFQIGPGTNYHIVNVEGMGKAKIRTSSMINSGRDGGKITQQFYAMRELSITGVIKSDTVAGHRSDRDALDEALPIGTEIPVYITLFDGSLVLINAHVTDCSIEYGKMGRHSDYKIELTAGDPLFYDQEAGLQSAAVNHAQVGGYTMPYDLAVNWDDGDLPTIVTNSGNALVFPTITLFGTATNPVITNQLTGELFKLNINMGASDTVIIDMKNRTVTLNGSSILANMDSQSTWWGIQIGDNPILLDSDVGADPVVATVAWRSGFTGV